MPDNINTNEQLKHKITNKHKLLIVADDPRGFSGVANQCRHICIRLAKQNNEVIVVGVTNLQQLQPPSRVKLPTGEEIKIVQSNRFDDMGLILKLMKEEKPDCLVLFTDPHKFSNIWINASFIREKIPVYFVHVWDTHLVPDDTGTAHYNLPIYECCDGIGCISKQTEWFVNKVYSKAVYTKTPYIHYVGHGSDKNIYKPLPPEAYVDVRNNLFGGKQYDFVAMMLNRNQGRKKFSDLIEAWKLFTQSLPKEQADKCALVLHTEQVADVGTNLLEVAKALAPSTNIYFSAEKYPEEVINQVYNIADVVLNISNAEGFGLSANEAALAGKCTILNATGGLVDQIGFFDNGIPIQWTKENYNNLASFQHGIWAYPIYGQRTIIGSPHTPYLYDYNASIDEVVKGLQYWYDVPKEERNCRGLLNRQFALDTGLNSTDFSINVEAGIKKTIADFKPVDLFHLYKI